MEIPKGRLNRALVRLIVESQLREVGFGSHMFRWHSRPNTLELLCGTEKVFIDFPHNLSKRQLSFQLGMIFGLGRVYGAQDRAPAPNVVDFPRSANQADLEDYLRVPQ